MRPGQMDAAETIAQALLDTTGRALDTGDYALMRSCFTLPYPMSTFDGKRLIETEQELEALFNQVRDEYMRQGVTRQVRYILEAERRSPTHIESTHITHLFAGNHRIKDPYPVLSTLRWDAERWIITSSDYAVEPKSRHSQVLAGLLNDTDTHART